MPDGTGSDEPKLVCLDPYDDVLDPASSRGFVVDSDWITVCNQCYNRRWLQKTMSELPSCITWENADRLAVEQAELFYEPCPKCNPFSKLAYGEIPGLLGGTWFPRPQLLR